MDMVCEDWFRYDGEVAHWLDFDAEIAPFGLKALGSFLEEIWQDLEHTLACTKPKLTEPK